MSKRINVNPDHYKVAGRERPGDALPRAGENKQLSRARSAKHGAKTLPGSVRRSKPKAKSIKRG